MQTINDHQSWQLASRTPRQLSKQVVGQMVKTALHKCHQEIRKKPLLNLLVAIDVRDSTNQQPLQIGRAHV